MAKKRKKDKPEEEEYEFEAPKFDEKEFLEKELRDTKTTLLTVVIGMAFGIAAGALAWVSTDLIGIGLIIAIAGIIALRYIYPVFRVNISEFTKKNWAGNVAWFFFTFLAVWLLMFNYPFADYADPTVKDVTIWVHNSATGNFTAIDYEYIESSGTSSWVWTPRWGEDLATMIRANASYTINITANVADNGKLVTADISIGTMGDFVTMASEGDHMYGYEIAGTLLSASSDLMFYIHAVDKAGNEITFYPNSPIPVSA